jgi:hypothetical protein
MASVVPLTEITSSNSPADAATLKSTPADSRSNDTAKAASSLPADLAAAKVATTPTVDSSISDSTVAADDPSIPESAPAAESPKSATRKGSFKVKATKAIAAPAKSGPAVTPAADAGAGHYAVQVGACRSAKCIETYRSLVTTHLPSNADHVHVVPLSADGSGVQRIRVAPLEKSEAQQLRTALIQADPRLSTAYVVEVRP